MNGYLVINENDNVGIALKRFDKGAKINYNNREIVLSEDIEFGHKIALVDMAIGEKVLKYGMSIGKASQAISCGELVHSHNLKSDY